jgi:hypothetical protein
MRCFMGACTVRHPRFPAPCAEPDQKRGPQLDALLAAFRVLKARGIGGAFVWALDNSCGCGYAAEAALLRIAAEPAPPAAAATHPPDGSGKVDGNHTAASYSKADNSCCCLS